MTKEVVALTGLSNAGKGEIARIMSTSYGFQSISLTDVLKAIALERYGNTERATTERVFNELGVDAMANKTILLTETAECDKVVIDSIRSVKLLEAVETSFMPDFHFVGVAAPRRERFERMRSRHRSGDPSTLDEFMQLDLIQLGDTESGMKGYEVRKCFARADIIVRNNTRSILDLESKVGRFLETLRIK